MRLAALINLGIGLLIWSSAHAQVQSRLSWRGVQIGMNPIEAVAAVRKIGLFPQSLKWGGRQEEEWQGTMPAFPKKGHCSGRLGDECEEAFLSFVRKPNGDEVLWIISAHTYLRDPTFVERLLAPAIDKFGLPNQTGWFNERRNPNATVEYPGWNARWFPSGSVSDGDILISLSIFPLQLQQLGESLPIMPDKNARAWSVDFSAADRRINKATRDAYEDLERKKPPPIRY